MCTSGLVWQSEKYHWAVVEDFVLPQTFEAPGIRAFLGLNMPTWTFLTLGPADLVGKARKRNPDFHQDFFFIWIAR